jgi:RimJ/RimL family protein N-acetyltransferase
MLTGRLVRLRPVATSDLDDWYVWFNDREVTRFLAGSARYPTSRAGEEAWLANAVHQTSPPEIALQIDTLDGRHIGGVGLHGISLENRDSSLGITIGDKDFWSHGYGTDAIITLLRFAFDEINLHRVWLTVREDNLRGIACYRKCGFVEEARLREDRYKAGRYWDTVVMGVLAGEFRALHLAEAGA